MLEGAIISAHEENRSDVAVASGNSIAMSGIRLAGLQLLVMKQGMRNYDVSCRESLHEERKLAFKDQLSRATKDLGTWERPSLAG